MKENKDLEIIKHNASFLAHCSLKEEERLEMEKEIVNAAFRLKDQSQPDFIRIANALEKVAKELERGNKLKALEFGKDRYDGTPREIRKIMEN